MLAEQKQERTSDLDYRILVIDDYSPHLNLLNIWLGKNGFAVAVVTDVYEAIARINNERFDLVLTDICLHRLNGNILAQYVHSIHQGVPVVAVTASPFLASNDFDLVLRKPYELEYLVRSLEHILAEYNQPGNDRPGI